MSSPLVSIVVPTFNTGVYLKDLIDAVRRQDYLNWELLIVDDISTDNTADMVAGYSAIDQRIKYFSRDRLPKGAQTCRNIGLQNAIGDYILFFDSDDLIADFCIEQRVEGMERRKDIDFGIFPATSFVEFPGDSNTIFFGFKTEQDILGLFICRMLPFVVWNNIYRLDALKRSGLNWDEELKALQDSDFNISVICYGLTFAFFEGAEIDYYWRKNPEGITSSIKSGNKNGAQLYFFSKLCRRLVSLGIEKKYKKEIIIQFIELLRIFSTSRDSNAINNILAEAKMHFDKITYFKLNAICELYRRNVMKFPYEMLFFYKAFRHKRKLFFLREGIRINNQKIKKAL